MEAVSRMASAKQVEFLADLMERNNRSIDRPLESLNVQEASELIDELLGNEGNANPVQAQVLQRRRAGDERTLQARLGMAFKLVYQANVIRGDGYVKKPASRVNEGFIEEVIEVFQLMNEVANRAGIDGTASL